MRLSKVGDLVFLSERPVAFQLPAAFFGLAAAGKMEKLLSINSPFALRLSYFLLDAPILWCIVEGYLHIVYEAQTQNSFT